MAAKKPGFEEAVSRLDEIVKHLESGDMSLSESLAMFEEGTKLIADCTKLLDEAEQTVVKLKKGADRQPVELPFEEDGQ